MCKSDHINYVRKHPNKPTEKLIEYLKGIVEEWIVYY